MQNNIINTITLCLLATFFTACQRAETTENTAENEVDSSVELTLDAIRSHPDIEIGTLQTRSIQTQVTCTGILDIPPTDRISVHSKVEGFLTDLRFIDGDFVKQGTVLARIENISFVQKQKQLLELKAQLELAKKQLQRQELLNAQEATSQKSLDEAQGQLALLNASYLGLKKELQLSGFQLEMLEKSAQFQSELPILAPATGYISHVAVNKGQMVHPNDEILEILNTEHLHVELKIFPIDALQVKINQRVTFKAVGSDKTYEAFVWRINPDIDPNSNTRNVHCHLKQETESRELLPGAVVQAKLYLPPHDQVGLPLEATVKTGDAYFAFVLQAQRLEQVQLQDPVVDGDFIRFSNIKDFQEQQVVVKGAYYLTR